MPTFLLQTKVDFLENVESLTPKPLANWKFDVENDGEERRDGITLCAADELELDGSRGTCNFSIKFNRGDAHAAYIKIEKLAPKKHGDGIVKQADKWTTVLVLECRGLTISKAYPGMDFDIKTVGEKARVFEDADFSS